MSHSHHHSHDPELERVSIGRLLFRVVLAVIIVGLLVSYSMYFQVDEGYKAVVTRFGKPVRAVHESGPYWKWPWPVEQVRHVDVRRRLHNTPYSATFTRDRRNVVLLTYVVWHVDDPLLYIQSVGERSAAEEKLNDMVVDRKHQYLGQHDLASLVSTDPGRIQTEQIEQDMLADVAGDAREKYGITVEQVGIKRIAYPEENMPAVLDQMKAERIGVAAKLRAEGKQVAQRIEDDASVQRAAILKEGITEAGKITGEAQKEATRIFQTASNIDKPFYTFWKQLQTLKKVIGENATLILRTDRGLLSPLIDQPEPPSAPLPSNQGASTGAPRATDQAAVRAQSREETP